MDTRVAVALVLTAGFLHLVSARALHKRAAFYIANETACVVDNIVYYNGDPIPTDDPCEACKCRPPGFACVLRECEVKPGCRAVRRDGHCCPEYVCGCEHNGRMYRDGDEIKDSQNPCYTCHCQGSAIACAFVDCFFRVDCAPEYVPGECCPRYDHCPPLGPHSNGTYVPSSSEPSPADDPVFTTISDIITEMMDLGDPHMDDGLAIEDESSEPASSESPEAEQPSDEETSQPADPTVLFYIPKEESKIEYSDDTTSETTLNGDEQDHKTTAHPIENHSDKPLLKSGELDPVDETDKTTIPPEKSDDSEKHSENLEEVKEEHEAKKDSDGKEESPVITEIHDAQNYNPEILKANLEELPEEARKAESEKESDPVVTESPTSLATSKSEDTPSPSDNTDPPQTTISVARTTAVPMAVLLSSDIAEIAKNETESNESDKQTTEHELKTTSSDSTTDPPSRSSKSNSEETSEKQDESDTSTKTEDKTTSPAAEDTTTPAAPQTTQTQAETSKAILNSSDLQTIASDENDSKVQTTTEQEVHSSSLPPATQQVEATTLGIAE